MDSNSSSSSISIRIYRLLDTFHHLRSSKFQYLVLHSPYCSLSRMYFVTHAECFLFFFTNKLAAPKLHDCRLPYLKRSGFSRRIFLGKSTTKSGRARVVEFSQNQTCRTQSETWSETRDANTLSGRVWSGPVRSGSVRVRLVEFGLN